MKEVIRKLVRAAGYEIRKYQPSNSSQARLGLLLKLHQVDLVVDVGANVGQYSRELRDLGFRGRIVSFEPLPQVHAALMQASERDSQWSVAPRMAIGDVDGEVVINVSDNLVSSSVRRITDSAVQIEPGVRQSQQERVRVARLDSVFPDFIGDSMRSFLKIDVQGFEDAVLRGAPQTLAKVCGVQIEVSLKPMYEGQLAFWDIRERLEHYGFELYAILPGFTDSSTGRMIELDGLFFRPD